MFRKLTSRNLKLYFRDRTSVFFSLLSVLIIIVLYVLFLAELQVDSVNQATNNMIPKDDLSYLIYSWILAGLLSVTTVTSTLGALGNMVNDRETRIIMDFKSAPIPGMVYPVASVVSAFVVGTIISLISFIGYSVYIFASTGYGFTIEQILQSIGLIALSSLMNAALMGFMVSFFKSNSSFTSASLIVGTIIGFVNGLYIPIGSLPEIVGNVIKFLPFGHIASLFRQVLMTGSIDLVFEGAPQEVRDGYITKFGVQFEWDGKMLGPEVSILFILLVFFVSLLLFFVNYRRKGEEI